MPIDKRKYGMKKICIYLSLIFFVFIYSNFAGEKKFYIHSNGYGPVIIGMTVDAASNKLGIPLKYASPPDEDSIHCDYVYPNGDYKSIGFMVEDGVITRVDIYNNSVSTDKGITVGSSEKNVYQKYGKNIIEKIHPYLGKDGKYLIFTTAKNHQIIFETKKATITRFRTGKLPSVAYIEGCL
jgi:hypothetical protein